ncbi:hypothetical protein [Thalassospira australica]|uniref:hypothetical protein n=1 Tax=Thalassospira australica TaxID=1528106 RepID=UPI000690B07F|nr:hypothetical protein [Thalassospira australica]
MVTLANVYEKFGEVSEAAQLLETELGTMLLENECLDADLIRRPDTAKASEILQKINKHTLGRLIFALKAKQKDLAVSALMLEKALDARNFLSHSFYRHHNFRRNSPEGRELMLNDLERLHREILDAYLALLSASGVNMDEQIASGENSHLPIKWVKI